MNLNFLSGLLLTIVVLGIVVFVAKEVIGDGGSGPRNVREKFARAKERLSGGEAKPVNEHLIGTVGRVTSHSDDSVRPIRVQLGTEFWSARPESATDDPLSIGSAVKVVAVDGAVLVVAAGDDLADSPTGS